MWALLVSDVFIYFVIKVRSRFRTRFCFRQRTVVKSVAKFFYATDYTNLHRLVAQISIRVFVALSKLQRSVIYAALSSMQVNLYLNSKRGRLK